MPVEKEREAPQQTPEYVCLPERKGKVLYLKHL